MRASSFLLERTGSRVNKNCQSIIPDCVGAYIFSPIFLGSKNIPKTSFDSYSLICSYWSSNAIIAVSRGFSYMEEVLVLHCSISIFQCNVHTQELSEVAMLQFSTALPSNSDASSYGGGSGKDIALPDLVMSFRPA